MIGEEKVMTKNHLKNTANQKFVHTTVNLQRLGKERKFSFLFMSSFRSLCLVFFEIVIGLEILLRSGNPVAR